MKCLKYQRLCRLTLTNLNHLVPKPLRSDFGIGAVGAGFIMRDVQLKAYADAGLQRGWDHFADVRRSRAKWRICDAIPKLYDTVPEMLRDPEVGDLDIAVPPDRQLEIVRQAVEQRKTPEGHPGAEAARGQL